MAMNRAEGRKPKFVLYSRKLRVWREFAKINEYKFHRAVIRNIYKIFRINQGVGYSFKVIAIQL